MTVRIGNEPVRVVLSRSRFDDATWGWLVKQLSIENVPVIELIKGSELHRAYEERVRV